MDITLGLDFGTHQSKLCINYKLNNEFIYEFVEFENLSGKNSVFLPSVIQINKDKTLRIGAVDYNTCATRLLPAPQKSVKPAPPCVVLPKEPDLTLPPEPKLKDFSSLKKEQRKDWKSALKTIKSNMTDKGQIMAEFKVKHKIWEQECQKIRQRHSDWERKYQDLRQKLLDWKKTVDEIEADYEREYSEWQNHNEVFMVYRYFKLASLTKSLSWDENEINPDYLCVWYLTYLLLYAQRYVKEILNEDFKDNVSVQMGIPSGLNDSTSNSIKYRGQRLLVAARKLMDLNQFDSIEKLLTVQYPALIDSTQSVLDKLTQSTQGNISDQAYEYGFIFIPEAYAGLRSLTYHRRLTRGNMHLLVDIGGGTTDIAFFTIDESGMPSIHTVKSFPKGLNYILENYISEHPDFSMGEAQELLRSDSNEFKNAIVIYTNELKKEIRSIIEFVVKEFKKVFKGTNITTSKLVKAMIGRPIVYCGGGSIIPGIRISHDYFNDIRLIDKEMLSIPNLINRNIEVSNFTILATAYGLSIQLEEDVKIIDIRHFWRNVANSAHFNQMPHFDDPDYGLMDD